jgi:uncharacterized protein
MEEENELNKKFKFDFNVPDIFSEDISKLKSFISKDKKAVIIFYGGEPLLEIEKIKKIIDEINVPFRMQTNGLLLDKLPLPYLNKIEKILVSIDGNKERTDENRGKGTYKKVIGNIKKIKNEGYTGEIIARMTLSKPDIFEQSIHLLNLEFESLHWQIDAGFYKCDYDEKKFTKFVKEYKTALSKLLDFWVKNMEKGKVIRIYPFIAIADSLIKKESSLLRCGAGHKGYAIATDGKIVACPIMNCFEDFVSGNLNTLPESLKKFEIKGRCLKCNYKTICGGRCLYWNRTNLWPEKGNEQICETIKFLINSINKKIPKINKMIEKKIISKKDFEYEKYFGPEIIP